MERKNVSPLEGKQAKGRKFLIGMVRQKEEGSEKSQPPERKSHREAEKTSTEKTRSKKERKKEERKRRRSDSLVSLVKEPGDRYNERENDKRKIVKE